MWMPEATFSNLSYKVVFPMRHFLALASAAGLALAVCLPASPAAAADNLLVNPGFETGNLSGWTCQNASVVTSPVRTGSFALSSTPTASINGQCTQTVTVVPNSAYTLSAWVRGSYVYIGATGLTSTWTPNAASFSQLSIGFTTGASTTSVQIFVHGWYAQPMFNVDDVVLA